MKQELVAPSLILSGTKGWGIPGPWIPPVPRRRGQHIPIHPSHLRIYRDTDSDNTVLKCMQHNQCDQVNSYPLQLSFVLWVGTMRPAVRLRRTFSQHQSCRLLFATRHQQRQMLRWITTSQVGEVEGTVESSRWTKLYLCSVLLVACLCASRPFVLRDCD